MTGTSDIHYLLILPLGLKWLASALGRGGQSLLLLRKCFSRPRSRESCAPTRVDAPAAMRLRPLPPDQTCGGPAHHRRF